MGGLGSTRWENHNTRQTVEDCIAITPMALRKPSLDLDAGRGRVILLGDGIQIPRLPDMEPHRYGP